MVPKKLNFITGNKNKLREVRAILGDTVELESQSIDLLEIQGTIEEVSINKAKVAADVVSSRNFVATLRESDLLLTSQIKGPVLVEDTCLAFNALKELPGPYV